VVVVATPEALVFVLTRLVVPEESFQVPSSLLEVMSPFLQLVTARPKTATANTLLMMFFISYCFGFAAKVGLFTMATNKYDKITYLWYEPP
jgi:hypothetical protein